MENNDEKEVKEEKLEEVKSTEQVKKESENKGKLSGKKTVKGKKLSAFIIVIIVIALAISYGSGFILGKILYEKKDKIIIKEQENDKEDNQKDENNEDKEDKENKEKAIVPYTDKYAMRKVYENIEYYLIDDGNLYYTNKDFILTHSGCLYDSTSDYCKMNKEYSQRMTKVEGISNVKRIKMYNRPGATDESFDFFAITEDGNVYTLRETKATIFLDNHDVEDMLSGNDGIEILLKNGKHMLYYIDMSTYKVIYTEINN